MIDPVDGKFFEINTKKFMPKKRTGNKVPVVFILPPINGENLVDNKMAQKFCEHGMAALILDVIKEQTIKEEAELLTSHDDSYVRALASVKTVISELKSDGQLGQQYGILGMSLGGMISAYIAGSLPEIKASVIVVGGGNIPELLTNSDQKRIKALRNARMKKFNLSDLVEYQQLMHNLVPHDPITVAGNIRPYSSYLFIALSDKTVPTKNQQDLRNEIPNPLVFEMKGNHVSGILKAGTIHSKKITNFFINRLIIQ